MALTLEKLQKLRSIELTDFFDRNRATYQEIAQRAYDYVKSHYGNSRVRPDDVANSLVPIITVDTGLQVALAEAKVSQKYWFNYFVDLIIDETWDEISASEEHDNAAN